VELLQPLLLSPQALQTSRPVLAPLPLERDPSRARPLPEPVLSLELPLLVLLPVPMLPLPVPLPVPTPLLLVPDPSRARPLLVLLRSETPLHQELVLSLVKLLPFLDRLEEPLLPLCSRLWVEVETVLRPVRPFRRSSRSSVSPSEPLGSSNFEEYEML
jgi:hypothetical protein